MRAAIIALVLTLHGIASAQQQNPPSNVVEQRLMQNLACTCATCNLEPIERCRCEQATKMRGEVKEAMRGVAVATADEREAAYQKVRALFATKYGDSVLTPNEKQTDPRMSWLPLVTFVGGAFLLILIARRSIRRGRA